MTNKKSDVEDNKTVDTVEVSDGLIVWEKPNGNKLTTNNAKETIAYCESLGFKRKKG